MTSFFPYFPFKAVPIFKVKMCFLQIVERWICILIHSASICCLIVELRALLFKVSNEMCILTVNIFFCLHSQSDFVFQKIRDPLVFFLLHLDYSQSPKYCSKFSVRLTDLVDISSFSLLVPWKFFLSASTVENSIIGVFSSLYWHLYTSLQALMVFKAYTEKLPTILLHFLYVTYIFSPAYFNILSLLCIFSVLTTIHCGNFIFGL